METKKQKQSYNFYELLELNKSASQDEIKSAYKRLALVINDFINIYRNGTQIRTIILRKQLRNSN